MIKRYHGNMVVTCGLEIYTLNLTTLNEEMHWTACDEYAFVCLFVFCLFVHASVCPSVIQSVHLSTHLSIHPSVCMSACQCLYHLCVFYSLCVLYVILLVTETTITVCVLSIVPLVAISTVLRLVRKWYGLLLTTQPTYTCGTLKMEVLARLLIPMTAY